MKPQKNPCCILVFFLSFCPKKNIRKIESEPLQDSFSNQPNFLNHQLTRSETPKTTPTDTWRSSQQDATRNLGAHLDETLWSLAWRDPGGCGSVKIPRVFPRPIFFGTVFGNCPIDLLMYLPFHVGMPFIYVWCV